MRSKGKLGINEDRDQAHWPKLTDEELSNMDGSRDELARALQHRYGLSSQQAQTQICEFEKDVRWPGAAK